MVSGSLCCNSCVVVMSMVSVIGMFTYRSLMSIVISLCLLYTDCKNMHGMNNI